MIGNKLKLTVRNLLRNKFYTSVNLVMLSLVLFVSLLIFLFVSFHYSFDKKISNYKNTYRINTSIGGGTPWASNFAAFDFALADEKEIAEKSIFYKQDEHFIVKASAKDFSINDPVYIDSSFISFFGIQLKYGNSSAIQALNSVFISPAMVNYFFDGQNPIGKTIEIERNNNNDQRKQVYTIAGVFEQAPKNSHLEYDILLSKKGDFEGSINHLKNLKVFAAFVYVKLQPWADPTEFQGKLSGLVLPWLRNSHGPPVEAFTQQLQKLSEIHYSTGINKSIRPAVRKSHLNILLVIGILLFGTVVFNFLLMTVVLAKKRRQQTQVVRFLGATWKQVVVSAFFEITVVVIASLAIAIIGFHVFGNALSVKFFNGWSVDTSSFRFWLFAIALVIVIITITTIASSISNLRKNVSTHASAKQAVPLLVIQFAAVIALISFTILVNKQLHFIKNKDLGYNPENVMIWRIPGARDAKINLLKQEAEQIPGVISAGTAQHYPGFRLQDANVEALDGNYDFKFAMLDMDGMKTLGVEMLEQFNFNNDFSFFINESFYNKLLKNYTRQQIIDGAYRNINDQLGANEIEFYINGVVKDFHYSSLYDPINSFCFFVRNSEKYYNRFLMLRVNQQNAAMVANQIEEIAARIYPGVSIEKSFLNNQLNVQYQSETQLLAVANIFSGITVFITCLGLLVFTLFNIQLRIKEIGIRKVNGASVGEITYFLNHVFIQSLLLGIVLGVPVAFYAMHKWLETFAFKVPLSFTIFIIAAIATGGIASLTISWQSWRAATRNPVEALRYE